MKIDTLGKLDDFKTALGKLEDTVSSIQVNEKELAQVSKDLKEMEALPLPEVSSNDIYSTSELIKALELRISHFEKIHKLRRRRTDLNHDTQRLKNWIAQFIPSGVWIKLVFSVIGIHEKSQEIYILDPSTEDFPDLTAKSVFQFGRLKDDE